MMGYVIIQFLTNPLYVLKDFYKHFNNNIFYTLLGILVFIFGFLVLQIKFFEIFVLNFLKNLVLSLYCIKVVRKYINLKQLKEIIKGETFEKLYIFNKENENQFDFYASENWIYINRLYIPKSMILDFYINYKRSNTFYNIKLLNNKQEEFTYIITDNVDKFLKKLKSKKIIPNIYYGKLAIPYDKFEKKYIEKFLKEIKTKKDFLELIKKDYYFTKKDLKNEFL